MTNVGSLSANGTAFFNLDTQAGITHLLASIRTSEMTTEQKSELRDLVFLYTNGGKDQTVRLALEQKITAYRVVAAPQKQVAPVMPPPPPIGTYRPSPTFSAPPQASSSVPALAPNFTAAPVWQPAPAPQPIPAPMPAPVAQVPVSSTPPPPIPPTPITPAPAPAPAAPVLADDDQQYLKRIREIKALVNEKVGNPVNLVDINNDVGREYMGALLDAMKKLNSGSSAASAMQRLEQAYVAVEKALEAHAAAPQPTPAPTPAPIPEPAPITRPSVPPPPPPMAPAPAEDFSAAKTRMSAGLPPNPPASPTLINVKAPPAYEPINTAPPVAESASFLDDSPVPKTGSAYTEAAPVKITPIAPVPPRPVIEEATPWIAEPKSAPPAATPQFSSLADLKEKPHTLNDLPTASSLKTTSVAGDPLFTKEVDDGLQQLLQEWPLFKKSGILGSGPKGREHPLFKKIATLQIPLLLAGRFEGATQEIKQSVTDYMNGWRYEQGLIYQQGETFEHYLRRVIRHILDLQKGR